MTEFRQLSLLCRGDEVDWVEELLFLTDAQAVTLNDDGDSPIFEPPLGTHPVWPITRLSALYADERSDTEILEDLALYLQRAGLIIELPDTLTLIPDQDWVRASLDQFKPLHIGGFWVRPSWQNQPPPPGTTVLHLDPGLAFGTGMHPTTQLCLEWLSMNPPEGQKVMDFGCGSGILAIAAGCLGASTLTGLDIDPQALIATQSNAALNQLEIETVLPEQTPPILYDLVMANILANPLIDLAENISGLLKPGGALVLAGLLDAQADAVQAAYPDIRFDTPRSKDGWTCLSGVKIECALAT